MNPLEVHGPLYIFIYLAICAGAFILALAIRAGISDLGVEPSSRSLESVANGLDAYDLAYLAGGADRVFLTASGALAKHNQITIDARGRTLTAAANAYSGKLHDLERTLLDRIRRNGASAATCKDALAIAVSRIESKLRREGLLCSGHAKGVAALVSWLFFVAVAVGFSVPRILEAAHTERAAGVLCVEAVVAFCVSFLLLRHKANTSGRGRAVLSAIKANNSGLKLSHATNSGVMSLSDSALAYALFGAMFLAVDPYRQAQAALYGVNISSGSGSSCGSSGSCGGSSCGGGGGCGGGGCGG